MYTIVWVIWIGNLNPKAGLRYTCTFYLFGKREHVYFMKENRMFTLVMMHV